ncbi:MAG TPA: molecular chaperone DnaK [Thermoanaerobaculia bacterium]|nr:molecular chaperone DnaK [Thermoanaerobaculia bacterium]
MAKILGIDLGTTNSCVAVVEGVATPRVLPNRTGSHTTPSIVAFTEENERLVGHIAKRQSVTNPENTIFAIKRLIGRKFDSPEVQTARELHLPYTVVGAKNGDAHVRVRDQTMSPEEISGILLRELRIQAEEALGEEAGEAIVTVPAYFDDAQRQATRDGCKIAGLEVRRILNEPTAAALAYCLDQRRGSVHIAVYDLGGGTFDISIMELSDGIFEVRATNGDVDLGGEDFDRRIMDWLIEGFERETGVNLRADRMALQRLKEAAERAKAELSTVEEAAINLPFISVGEEGPRHLSRSLTRAEFEALVGDLVERTAEPCYDALRQAGLEPGEIDEVLLVGGQTRSPCVVRAVEDIFAQAPKRDLNPDEVVAIGAAIQGGILQGSVKDVVLLDVTPLSLGIETQGGIFTKLIERNSTIPTKASQIFTTVVDNQDTVEIHILQGEREISSENRSLGKIELVGIPPAPRGVPQIEVTFAIDSNSIHTVSARDLATNQSQTMTINPASGLSQDEVGRLVADADRHATEDHTRREVKRLRGRLEGLLYTNERVFEQFVSYLPDSDQERIREIFRKSLAALISDKREDMEAAMFDLNSVSQDLSDIMLRTTRD